TAHRVRCIVLSPHLQSDLAMPDLSKMPTQTFNRVAGVCKRSRQPGAMERPESPVELDNNHYKQKPKASVSRTNLQQVPNLLNTAAITSRVYSLSLEENKKMAIKEVMYVDLSRSANYTGSQKAALARPFWVPAHIQQGCWSEQPPCYWKVDIHSMQRAKLIYNPLADYTLELMRFYRPDLFEHIFHLFRVWCKRLYNDRQVSTIKEIIQAEKLPLEDFSAHFSQTSPVVPTLRSATLADDILPEIEHYLALLSIRAYLLRDTLMHIR
uniref:NDC10_II domain-containing protein n=1 Tax=Macrostomum lignano TaxID=282301 RepID=A0A1I8HCE7_9PLAT